MTKLAVHSVGARVVELLFATLSAKSTAGLKHELYGPHFVLFHSDNSSSSATGIGAPEGSLASYIKEHPEKKALTLAFLLGILQKGMEKGLFGFAYFQDLLCDYTKLVSPEEIRSSLCSGANVGLVDNAIHMVTTRPGTFVVAECAAYGTAKDRKRIIKSLKGYSRSSLLHRDAYLLLLRLIQVTDDTVSVHKSVLAELLTAPSEEANGEDEKSSLLDLALDDNASKMFLMLLVSGEDALRKYLDPYELEVLSPNPTVLEGGEQVPTSKKNAETRRKELVQYLRKPLTEMCIQHCQELLTSLPGARVLREVYVAFHSQEVVDAILIACKSSIDGDDSLFEHKVGHHSIKSLLQCDQEGDASFAHAFVEQLKGHYMDIAKSNRGAFVLTALCEVTAVKDQVSKELREHKKKLLAYTKKKQGKPIAGYEALLKAI